MENVATDSAPGDCLAGHVGVAAPPLKSKMSFAVGLAWKLSSNAQQRNSASEVRDVLITNEVALMLEIVGGSGKNPEMQNNDQKRNCLLEKKNRIE